MSILRTIFKEILNLPPSSQELRAEQNYLNQQATDLASLIPWSDKEIDILSIKYHKASTRGKTLDQLGYVDSIYHEPMISYAARYYRRQKDVSLKVIFTSGDRFTYLTQKGETKVYYESRLIGRMRDKEYLLAPRKNGALLRFIQGNEPYGAVLRGREALAQLITPSRADIQNPRAVIMLSTLSEEAMTVFKAFTFYLLIDELTKG